MIDSLVFKQSVIFEYECTEKRIFRFWYKSSDFLNTLTAGGYSDIFYARFLQKR